MSFWSSEIQQRWNRRGKSTNKREEGDEELEKISIEHVGISFVILGLGLFIASIVLVIEICTLDSSSIQDQDHQSDLTNAVDLEFSEVDDCEPLEKYSDIESDYLEDIQLDSPIENDINTEREIVESSGEPDIFVIKDNSYC